MRARTRATPKGEPPTRGAAESGEAAPAPAKERKSERAAARSEERKRMRRIRVTGRRSSPAGLSSSAIHSVTASQSPRMNGPAATAATTAANSTPCGGAAAPRPSSMPPRPRRRRSPPRSLPDQHDDDGGEEEEEEEDDDEEEEEMKESQKKVEPSPLHWRFLRPQTLGPVSFKPYRSDRSASTSSSAAAAASVVGDGALDLSGLREALPPLAGDVRHPPQRRRRRRPGHIDRDVVALLLCLCFSRHHTCAARAAATSKVVDESPGSGLGEAPMLRGNGRRRFLSLTPPGEAGRCTSSCDSPPPQLSGEEQMEDQME